MAEDEQMEHRWEELLPGYALGALTPSETQEIEAHLRHCERCAERLRWLEPAVDVIPASVEQVEPPPELKASLMAIVRADAAVVAETEAGAPQAAGKPWWRVSRVSLHLRPALALTAVALVAAGTIGYALNSSGDDGASTPETILVDAVPSENVKAAAVLERSGEGAVLHVERLPALDRDDVYQLWVRRGDEVIPKATFELSGDRTAAPEIAKLPPGAEEILVTREPDGGSETPSTEPVLSATIS